MGISRRNLPNLRHFFLGSAGISIQRVTLSYRHRPLTRFSPSLKRGIVKRVERKGTSELQASAMAGRVRRSRATARERLGSAQSALAEVAVQLWFNYRTLESRVTITC